MSYPRIINMSTIKRKSNTGLARTLILAAVLMLTLGGVWIFGSRLFGTEELGVERAMSAASESGSAMVEPIADVVGGAIGGKIRHQPEIDLEVLKGEPAQDGKKYARGVVFGLDTGMPLCAKVVSGSEESTCLSDDGSFLIAIDKVLGKIDISHPRYVSREVYLDSLDHLESINIVLVPDEAVTVRVVDENGIPQKGVTVSGVKRQATAAVSYGSDWSMLLGVTDETGELEAHILKGAVLFASVGKRISALTELREPNESSLHIVLPTKGGSRLGLQSDLGDAMKGFSIVLQPIGSFSVGQIRITTSEQGQCTHLLPLGDYKVHAPQHSIKFVDESLEKLPTGARRAIGAHGHTTSVLIGPDNETKWLTASIQDSPRVVVVDESGKPIVPFQAWEEKKNDTPFSGGAPKTEWRIVQSRGSVEIWDGWLSLGLFSLSSSWLGRDDYRIAIGAPGFETSHIASHPILSADGSGTVVLRAHSEDCRLLALTPSGIPFDGRLRLESSTHKSVIFDGMPDERSGLVGPFTFNGPESLLIYRYSSGRPVKCGEVKHALFKEGHAPVVEIDASSSIRFRCGREDVSSFLLINNSMQEHRGKIVGEMLLFEGLSSGRYALVTSSSRSALKREFLDLSLNFGKRTEDEIFPIVLGEGEHRTLSIPTHLQPKDIFGEIRVPEGLTDELFILPQLSGESLPRRLGENDSRIRLPLSGKYRLVNASPAPVLLTVIRIDEAGVVVPLGSFLPGDDYELMGAIMQVDVSGLDGGCIHAGYQYRGARRVATSCSEVLDVVSLGWLPSGKVTVKVIDNEDRFTSRDVSLRHGEPMIVEVDAALSTRQNSWGTVSSAKDFAR